MTGRIAAEYVLPIRRADIPVPAELRTYLRLIAEWIDVTVVDGSDPAPFAALAAALAGTPVRHVPPEVDGLNGKARGAMTGIRRSRHERIVVADDDVRHTPDTLAQTCRMLADADFVRLQNHYRPVTWWARWDTGRMLLNRAFGGDYGGTVGIRRGALPGGGYRTDVLFENLELERTVAAAGGRVVVARHLSVLRRPPTLRHFLGQRVRQAYDDFAQPGRLILEAALLPLVVLALATRRSWLLAGIAAGAVVCAERGRRVDGGATCFPPDTSLWAVAWLGERAVTVWLAALMRMRGGVPYAGSRVRVAASSPRALRVTLNRTGRPRRSTP